ncbi:hypothetical protein CR513_23692, partial [Mucuna pruriens]
MVDEMAGLTNVLDPLAIRILYMPTVLIMIVYLFPIFPISSLDYAWQLYMSVTLGNLFPYVRTRLLLVYTMKIWPSGHIDYLKAHFVPKGYTLISSLDYGDNTFSSGQN